MTKQVDKTNRIWYETEGAETKIGFTPAFLEKLQECFHIVPGKKKTFVRENGPLMAIETNEGLFSIASPVRGMVTFFSDNAMNFPEQLKEEDTVCILSSSEKKAVAKKKEMELNWDDEPFGQFQQQPPIVQTFNVGTARTPSFGEQMQAPAAPSPAMTQQEITQAQERARVQRREARERIARMWGWTEAEVRARWGDNWREE